jgi:hypothetical protein
MRNLCWLALVAAAAAGSLASACGPSFDGTLYRTKEFAFRVPAAPASWQRLQAEGVSLAFRDEASGATIAISGRCGKDADDVPLASLTQHLFLQFTEREVLSQEVVPFDRREAMHTVLAAKLDGVPRKFDIWVLKKDGCVYDMDFIGDPARFDGAVGEFRKFVSGFATVPVDG